MSALLIACGALAREVLELRERYTWQAVILALPAQLHNRPEQIPEAVKRRISSQSGEFDRIIVVYGDCGTGGLLEETLAQHGWQGLAVPHCYALFAGTDQFEALMAEEPGSFFLTDYLVASFDHLVVEGLGLDRHPELKEEYFRHYRRVVYLRQHPDDKRLELARNAARWFGLPLQIRDTGLTVMAKELTRLIEGDDQPGSSRAGAGG